MDGERSLSGSSVHGDFPSKNTGVGCHSLLQEIFPDPGINPVSLASPSLAGGFFTTESQEFREGQTLYMYKNDTNILILGSFHFALTIHVLVAH